MDGWGNGSEKEFQKKKKPRVGGVEVETQTQYDYSGVEQSIPVYRCYVLLNKERRWTWRDV